MAYIRYKLPDPTHKILKNVALRLGMKESEISRVAMMEYLKSLGILGERVRKPSLAEKLATMKPQKREAFLSVLKKLKKAKKVDEVVFDI